MKPRTHELPKVPRMRSTFTGNEFGVDYLFELHKPRAMEIPERLDPVFWHKNHPRSDKAFRKWFVFSNRADFEKFFMGYCGVVPELKENWHDGFDMDWVLADDGGICEIIKKNKMATGKYYVRTIVGTFLLNEERRDKMPFFMDTDFKLHANRSSFSGVKYRHMEDWLARKKKLSQSEKVFAANVTNGAELISSYQQCYPKDREKSKKILERRALVLLGTERVKRQVNKNLEEVFQKEGVDHKFLIDKMKKLIELMEGAKDYRGAVEGVKTLAKGPGTFEGSSANDLKGGVVGMLKGFQQFSLEGDVEELEEVKQIEGEDEA